MPIPISSSPRTLYQDFIDPSKRDLAITYVSGPAAQPVQLFADKPSKFTVEGFNPGDRREARPQVGQVG